MSAYLVVMAGGSGTRFWPKSTSKRPKQLLGFGKNPTSTLLTDTLTRFDGICAPENRCIVTTKLLEKAVTDQLNLIRTPQTVVLAEPAGRNTAPCVYWAAREIYKKDPRGVMMVMPSDHYIAQPEQSRKTVAKAVAWAQTHDDLVTLGVKPNRPETGFGYLKMGETLGDGVLKLEAFVEKPNLEKAKEFVSSGKYYWNGGMFLWRAEVILKAFDQYMPEMKEIWDRENGNVDAAYPKLTATSIDYGIMEKAKNVVTFPIDCGWDDLGSWDSLESVAKVLDAVKPEGTVTGGDVVAVDAKGNIIDAAGKKVALLGVDNLIIVVQGDTILVADKNRSQDIRQVVELVKKNWPELA